MSYTCGIGAGHGGYVSTNPKVYATAGKRTPDGEPEWLFNDKIVEHAIKHLNFNGIKTVRLDDPTGKTDVPLAKRKAKGDTCDVYVSIHNNANKSVYGTHGGTETFYYEGSDKSKKLASLIHKEAVKVIGAKDRGLKNGNHLYEISKTKPPSALFEALFMDGIEDIKKLRDDKLLAEVGKAVAKGICSYFGLVFMEPSAPKPSPVTGKIFRVQVGAFGNKENATKLANELKAKGYPSIIVEGEK